MTNPDLDALLAVLSDVGRLKTLRRAGWVRAGVPEPESVADHSYRVAVLALLIGPRLGLNVDRLVRLALLHDLAEARVGDLTPLNAGSPGEKAARESEAFADIVGGLSEGPALYDLWREYEGGATPEARIAKQLDKLELALQTLEYEQAALSEPTAAPLAGPRWADEFWASARSGLSEPLLIALFDRLAKRRPIGTTEE
jgi:putative hydrolase of HD superfamily